MAEYIYCINPDKNTIREISEKDGIVVWNIPCAADKVTENDTIYLYINTGDDKNKNSYICYSGCIAYKATVLEVLADRNKKKLLKLHIRSLAPFATKELSKYKLGETDPTNSKYIFHPSQSYPIDLNTRSNLKKSRNTSPLIVCMKFASYMFAWAAHGLCEPNFRTDVRLEIFCSNICLDCLFVKSLTYFSTVKY